jgi:hypothetical protein
MSKIKELLKDKDSVLVFDVDGVLAILEFGEYNHYYMSDDDWDNFVNEDNNLYTKDKVSKKMQKFLKDKDKSRIYVITAIGVNKEGKYKKEYVEKYYDIIPDNVYFVDRNNDKRSILNNIKNKYPKLEDYKLIMIDDTPDILTDIQENTNFSTAHISSFLDI